MRTIFLALIPCAAILIALSEPITRLVYERGAFDAGATDDVATALFWFAFSLPFAGANLMLTRTFFALQQPWLPTRWPPSRWWSTPCCRFALYSPFGIAGVVLATAISSLVMTLQQVYYLRRELQGFEIVRTLRARWPIMTRGGRGRRRDRLRRPPRCSTTRSAARLIAQLVAVGLRRGGGVRGLRRARRSPRGCPRRAASPPGCGPPNVDRPCRAASATSRSSPTSTTGSRRWPTASSR